MFVSFGEVLPLGLTILGSITVAGIAAVLAHRFTSQRDLANRRSDLRTEYLVSAYRTISDAIQRDLHKGSDDARALERGLADIQLLGSEQQAEMAVQIGQATTAQGEANPDALLRSLRDDLRDELGLDELSLKLLHVRVITE